MKPAGPVRMPVWSRSDRGRDFAGLSSRPVDLLVIGGGITGAGIALDAAARGLRTALVDKGDFASGTSSRSSKLIHGGLRYLRQGQWRTTRESSRERATLQRLAPHLVEDLPFLLPVDGGLGKRLVLGTGMWLYGSAGGRHARRGHRHLDRALALEQLPSLAPTDRSAYVFHDARADDCRLTLHVLKRAVSAGCTALSYVRVDELCHSDGQVSGARLRDVRGGSESSIEARVIVNATGVWCDELRRLDQPRASALLRPSKGVHLLLPRERVRNRCAVAFSLPRGGPSGFLLPWGERAILGTTDTEHDDDLDEVRATAADVELLLSLANERFPDLGLGRGDVLATWAGLRPLLGHDNEADPSRAPRDDVIERSPSGLISVTGGKLTTYRHMAERVVDRVAEALGRTAPCTTRTLALFAAPAGDDPLVRSHGSEAAVVRGMQERDGDLARPLVESRPESLAEAVYALEHERAVTLADLLLRRTRLGLLAPEGTAAAAESIARFLAVKTGWDVSAELDEYSEQARLFGVPA
ncbi:MAG: glycerol-3-phosphate dehydrogenase/oxidase [Planctomycetota bacterium]|nr:glycerol-3-phosphate dehydrogenase/oxidase [Planctomycetota bacterium]MDP6763615.1 glycerol-3-phosphate dehydrogenase/oxidase [Planctomycetota bacterium]MDP6989722.1 glycerol-3-phosphate dehydrogenase/oxidase [Planctomycetota bacterium]